MGKFTYVLVGWKVQLMMPTSEFSSRFYPKNSKELFNIRHSP
jgi:hypothetical protein